MEQLQGREEEIVILNNGINSERPVFMAVFGRRRVGKTFLIDQVLKDVIDFKITGIHEASTDRQLINFWNKVTEQFKPSHQLPIPNSWMEAFELLKVLLKKKKAKKRKILFFDELPWLATPRSDFLSMLGHFWNDWAEKNNVMLVVCGSAATWMIKKLIHHKGGLHNRITHRIHLKPFTLMETKAFLKERKIPFDHYQIVQVYMMLGGIPQYLNELKASESVAQNIDRICFSKQGFLKDEFDKLYSSLYDQAENHIYVVRALASTWKGLTRGEIIQHTQLADGGSLNRVLEELEQSDFITISQPLFNKKKDALYRLTDAYSLFYLKFIEGNKKNGPGTFISLAQNSIYKSWNGYAFENVCVLHFDEIKNGLGIAGVYALFSSYVFKGNDDYKGMQVDMVIDRADGVITLCEMKFYNAAFTITNDYAKKLRQTMATFKEVSRTNKNILLAMITPFGVKKNANALSLVQNDLTIDIFFN